MRRLLIAFGVLLAIAVLAFAFRGPVLRAVAAAWVVDDSGFERVELAIVPGGGLETRPFGAAAAYREGRAAKVATFRMRIQPAMALGLQPPDHEIALAILRREGVPETDILLLGDQVDSTWDEVRAVRDWCAEHRPAAVAVYTEIFPSRRVRRTYRRALAPLGVRVHVVAMEPSQYKAADWWQEEHGIVQFQNEVLKSIYYALRGR